MKVKMKKKKVSVENSTELHLEATFVGNQWLERIFCSQYVRWMIMKSQKKKHLLEVLILLMTIVLGFLLRLFSVTKYESIIHEFDPYFNYRLTNILNNKGFYEFWNYFDEKSWFPLGRKTGQTLFPGLMLTTVFIYKIFHFFGFLIELKNICIYIGPICSCFTCLITYLITKEIYSFNGTALFSALFVSISPTHIARTVAGSFDNESICIFLLLLCIYGIIKCLKKGTLYCVFFCSLSTYVLALSWGAYIFVINSYSCFIFALIMLKKFTLKQCIIYNSYYILTSILCLNIPCISRSVLTSIEHLCTHGIFLTCNFLIFCYFLFRNMFQFDEEKSKRICVKIFFFVFFCFCLTFMFTKKLTWSNRSRALIDPFYIFKNKNPVVLSISEHQPTIWASYLFDIHYCLLFFPIGLYKCFKKNANIELFYFGLCSILSLYFSARMIRLLLIFSPFACILNSAGLSFLVSIFVSFLRVPKETFRSSSFYLIKKELNEKKDEKETQKKVEGDEQKMRKKNTEETKKQIKDNKKIETENIILMIKKLKFNRRENSDIPILLSLIILSLLIFLGILTVFHSTWCAAIAYSETNVFFLGKNAEGEKYIKDDIRQMYEWINQNTLKDSNILAWWDYGYQLNVMSNRTVYIDNNTWNENLIATVGLILSSDEQIAYQYLKQLNANYVLIFFGGYSKTAPDDLNKFLWILKITNKIYKHIIPLLYYYNDNDYTLLNDNTTFSMSNSVLYKLSYYRLTNNYIKAFDYIRKFDVPVVNNLTYFEEVFTTDSFVCRLYKIKDYVI